MVVGVVDHQAGTRDIRLLAPLLDGWTGTKAVAAVSAASMAGVPLLLGFVAKESAYTAFTDGPFSGSGVVLAGLVIGSTLTVAYSLRFLSADSSARRTAGALPSPPSAGSRVSWPLPQFSAAVSIVTGDRSGDARSPRRGGDAWPSTRAAPRRTSPSGTGSTPPSG